MTVNDKISGGGTWASGLQKFSAIELSVNKSESYGFYTYIFIHDKDHYGFPVKKVVCFLKFDLLGKRQVDDPQAVMKKMVKCSESEAIEKVSRVCVCANGTLPKCGQLAHIP